ncbi:MAG: MarR family winged helix-turn-helix transcriptional regulator [Hyphomonadaceae bacterium]|nr:MarR family winged helix-turn-helix transcriptional regulator [Hyphomonadaceae bacterium]
MVRRKSSSSLIDAAAVAPARPRDTVAAPAEGPGRMGQKSSDDEPSVEFALSRSPTHMLHRAQQLAADHFAAAMGDTTLTLRQFAVLAAAAEKPGRSQTDLVRATGVDRSTLADMILRMEKRGFLVREEHAADGRANAISLTAAGRAMLALAAPHARDADDVLLGVLPKGKRKTFQDLLARLAKAAEPKKEDKKKRRAAEKAALKAQKAKDDKKKIKRR